MQLLNIPAELRERPQWVCCGPDKVPINPRTKRVADPTDPATWATFEEALTAGFKHVGYVLHKSDPYTIIDLDNKVENPAPPEELERFSAMIEAFASYTERSASGRGWHIIVRGNVPKGARRGHVEVYSDARFMICTGDVERTVPIAERQELLTTMYSQLAPVVVDELGDDGDEVLDDAEIHEMALGAENAEKYDMLTRGPDSWREGGYPSQSEADLALMSMYTFYSKSNEQCKRLFLMSPLGKREKALRPDYMVRMLKIARTKQANNTPPPIDYKFTAEQGHTIRAVIAQPKPEEAAEADPFTFPEGLIGDIAQHILATSLRPVKELALCAAIACVAGVAGRTYNTYTKAGLNQYIIVLAKTGCGKEAMASGIDSMFSAVRSMVPACNEFQGPAHFASGPAVVKTLVEQPCLVSVLGEIGITLQTWSDPRANSAEKMIFKVLLDAHGKSGFHQSLKSSAYSDKDKTTKVIQAPNLTVLGESVPSKFYEALNVEQISSGLIPRFLVVEYDGERPEMNEATDIQPRVELVQQFADLCTTALTAKQNNACHVVPMSPDAMHVARAFNQHCDTLIREGHTDVEHQLWSRGHLHAIKLATLLAVGVNHRNPIVSYEQMVWACKFVEHCISRIVSKFTKGEVGQDQGDAHMDKAIRAYLMMSPDQRMASGGTKGTCNTEIIPAQYFYNRLRLREPYKSDRRGASKAIQDAVENYIRMDLLQLVPLEEARTKYGAKSGRMYVVGIEFNG